MWTIKQMDLSLASKPWNVIWTFRSISLARIVMIALRDDAPTAILKLVNDSTGKEVI